MSESGVEANAPKSRRGRILRRLRIPAVILAIVVGVFTLVNAIMGALAARWDANAPRDPSTGILIGAEELNLGPEDAEVGVLLVHGFVGGSNNFGELPQRLADEGFRVRAMRLPGHGTTPSEFAVTPLSEFSLAVLREVRALKEQHERVYVVGHSMGGALATVSAAIEPVDGLVLAAPYFGVTHQWYYGLAPETWTKLTAPAVRWVYKSRPFIRVNREEAKDHILSYRWIPASGSVSLVNIGERASDPFLLEQIECPVLLMHGTEDFAASPGAAERAFGHLGSEDKRLVWYDESDHHLFWDHDREAVIEQTLEFVNRLESSNRGSIQPPPNRGAAESV